uniref:Ricin B lectin domain-containing protein n=1 Tax=Monopterus albus TaxID=43700 RepID=A0A3Q3J210_MONAL
MGGLQLKMIIWNKLLGTCLQVQEGTSGGRVSLGECSLYSPLQEWRWLPESQALLSYRTGECLTAPGEEFEGVRLQRCNFRTSSQAWSCSKKGHLTSIGRGLHLSATHESTLVFLSRGHKQVTEPLPCDTTSDSKIILFGMAWKITMLVLSSLALVLGTVVLILNVYSNRKKMCVLKSYTPSPEVSVPGSPVLSERAPLTEHAIYLPHSSPTLQRGEILIEWKDGSVTPLYEA